MMSGTSVAPPPSKPIRTPCPMRSSHVPPWDANASPAPIMTAPNNAVRRTPKRSATSQMPEHLHPSQAMPVRWPMQVRSLPPVQSSRIHVALDGRHSLVDRLRPAIRFLEFDEASFESWLFSRPQLAHSGDVFISPGAALLKWHPKCRKLLAQPANTNPEQDATPREMVQRGDLF